MKSPSRERRWCRRWLDGAVSNFRRYIGHDRLILLRCSIPDCPRPAFPYAPVTPTRSLIESRRAHFDVREPIQAKPVVSACSACSPPSSPSASPHPPPAPSVARLPEVSAITAPSTALGVDLRTRLGDPAATLSGGQKQAVAIARAIVYGSRCLILDEPTAALAVRQTQQVLDQVRRARDAGQAVILIMHNLQQAMSVADEVVVLARGRVMGQFSHKAVAGIVSARMAASISSSTMRALASRAQPSM